MAKICLEKPCYTWEVAALAMLLLTS